MQEEAIKKIAIVCGAKNSEFLAPFDDPTWEIWVLGNRLNRFIDKKLRVSRFFEIHNNLSEHKDVNKYIAWLDLSGLNGIVSEKFPISNEKFVKFDYEQSKKLYGALYLTSSPAYMMSQAISEGATEIGVYGVDLAVDDHEYFWQRPCMEAWIGFAKGRGIKVTIPEVSNIGRCSYVEGRDWNGVKNEYGKRVTGTPPFTHAEFELMAEQHDEKISILQDQIRNAELAIHLHSGGKQAYERLAKVARAVEAGVDVKNISDSALIK